MIRKLLSFAVVLSLLLMPMAALGEGETLYGQFTISDPVLAADGQTIDLTGLTLLLTGAYDLSDTSNPLASLTAQVQANGVEALTGAVALDKEKVAGMLNGLAKNYFAKYDALVPGFEFTDEYIDMLDQFVAAMGTGITYQPAAAYNAKDPILSKLETLEPVETQIEYNGETVAASMVELTISEDEMIGFITDVYTQMGVDGEAVGQLFEQMSRMSMKITVYTIDESNAIMNMEMLQTVNVEDETTTIEHVISMNMVAKDEQTATITGEGTAVAEGDDELELSYTFEADVVAPDENNVDMTMKMYLFDGIGEDADALGTIDFSMLVKETEEFEDAALVEFEMIAHDDASDEEANISFSLTPVAVEKGLKYDYAFSAGVEGEMVSFTGSYADDGANCRFAIDIDAGDDGALHFDVGGDYAGEGMEYSFDGDMSFSGTIEGSDVEFSMNFALLTSADITDRLLDIAALDGVDISTLSELDFEALSQEAGMVLMGSLGIVFQQLPGVAALLSSLEMDGSTGEGL